MPAKSEEKAVDDGVMFLNQMPLKLYNRHSKYIHINLISQNRKKGRK